MKKILAVVLTIMLVVGVMPMSIFTTTASAATTGDCTWSVSGTVLTISGTGRMRDYDHLTEHPWSNDITEVVIGEGVTHIGDRAFKNCKLERVVIPENVTSIGAEAFSACGVKTVYYNAKNCNSEWGRFYYVYNSYGQYKTYDAKGPGWGQINTIVFGDNVQSIGEYMFHGCSQLTKLAIPDNVSRVDKCAFEECDNLALINISNASIGDFAFNKCSSLVSVTIGNSVTSIGDSAFQSCTSLTSVTIGNSVTSIGDNAFGGCSSLTSITIPDSVTSIGERAFRDCSSLTSITIPDSVTSIGERAFRDCTSLSSMTLPFVGASRTASEYRTDVFGYLFGYTTSYTSGTVSQTGGYYYIPSSLKSVTITDAKEIPSGAFKNCTSLTSISISDSTTAIGYDAFYNTGYYNNSSNWENGVLYIGNHLIEAKTTISGTYTITNGTLTIAEMAFYECASLTSVSIPDSVTNIGEAAFRGTRYYNDISNWENGALYIDNYLIEADTTISNDYIVKNGTTTIANSAFKSPTLLSISFPKSLVNIGAYAFSKCTSITDVWFSGEKQNLTVGDGNDNFLNASWHYFVCEDNQHIFEYDCDSTCEFCEFTRNVGHEFDNTADLICNHCPFERKNPAPISVYVSGTYEYDNSNAIIPKTVVYYKNQALKENVDFLVTYSNNENIGKAKISIKGIGDYEGIKHEVTFKIVPKDISSAEVTVASCSYTGNPLKPKVTVTLDGVELSSSNYNVYYYDNTLVGTAYVVIVGKGNYCGMIKKNFTIGKYAVVPSSTSYRLCDGSVSSYSVINASTGAIVKSASFNAPGGSYADFTGVSSGTYYVKYYTRSSTIRSTMSGAYFVWTGSAYGPYTTSLISFTSANSPAPSYTLPKSLIAEKPIVIDCRTLLFTVSSTNSYDCLDDIIWTSSNENLATISKGVITLKKAGDFKVTATIGDISASWDISIEKLDFPDKAKLLDFDITTKKAKVVYDGEVLKDGTDYTVATQKKGNATIVTVTGINLFDGKLTEIFYSDTGYKYCTDKITISQLPEKLEYKANKENLDLSGAKLSVDLGNNQSMTVELTEDMVSGYDNTVAGEQEIIVTFCGQTTTFKVEVYAYTAGDLTGDDKINSLDGLMLLRHLNGWTLNIASPEAMDVNADGKVNSLDGLMLMRYLNGWNITLG